ncbi:hypothetical protein M6B38_312920 [Iris pallida]|uniref:Uncharacterized protein n=2 Tax=Iris pallida TaxID=29817 RepID=A0AAX6HHH2_IRIPA|nr:hypothetical protein M6B38_312920 [Iris pallida]
MMFPSLSSNPLFSGYRLGCEGFWGWFVSSICSCPTLKCRAQRGTNWSWNIAVVRVWKLNLCNSVYTDWVYRCFVGLFVFVCSAKLLVGTEEWWGHEVVF